MTWPHLVWRWGISFGSLSFVDPLDPVDNVVRASIVTIVTSRPFFNYGIHAPLAWAWETSYQLRYRTAWTAQQIAIRTMDKYVKPAAKWTMRYTAATIAGIGLGIASGFAIRQVGFFGEEGSESYIAATRFYSGKVGHQEYLTTLVDGFILPITRRS